MVRRLVSTAALVIVLSGMMGPPAAADDAAGFSRVGGDPFDGRGLNAGLALADHCAYVGSRGQGPVEIIDISVPTHPSTAGQIAAKPHSTARELRALPEQRLLVVMTFALDGGGVNRFDFYSWGADCTHPYPVGGYDLGRPPHEFYLWHTAGRTLLFTTMFGAGNPALQVLDATDPAHPSLAGGWDAPGATLHSISLSADGARAFLSLWKGGFLVADASDFTGFRPNPTLHLITQPADAVPSLPGGNVHSAVEAPGRSLILLTDERYPSACPYGPARLVDIADAAHPRVVSTLRAPENDPSACARAPINTYTSHNPTLTANLALVTWYASGLQAFDISDPSNPTRLAEHRPEGTQPTHLDTELVGSGSMSWSYPIIRNGLVYMADVNQGLIVLRYQGPHEDEVTRTAFAEGNSNLTPSPSSTPTPSPNARPPKAPRAFLNVWATPAVISTTIAAALAAGLLFLLLIHRRRR